MFVEDVCSLLDTYMNVKLYDAYNGVVLYEGILMRLPVKYISLKVEHLTPHYNCLIIFVDRR